MTRFTATTEPPTKPTATTAVATSGREPTGKRRAACQAAPSEGGQAQTGQHGEAGHGRGQHAEKGVATGRGGRKQGGVRRRPEASASLTGGAEISPPSPTAKPCPTAREAGGRPVRR